MRVPITTRTKPQNYDLRYERSYWARSTVQPALFLPLFGPGKGGTPDYSANSNNPAVVGGVTWKSGGASLDGSTGYLNCNSPSNFNFGASNYLFSVWFVVNSTPATTRYQIFSKDASTGRQWTLEINESNAAATQGAVGHAIFQSNTIYYGVTSPANAITAGQLTHVVAGRSGNSLLLWVNGKLQTTTAYAGSAASPGTMQSTTTAAYAGARVYSTFQEFFPGTLYQLEVLPVAPTSNLVTALYNEPWAMFERRRAVFGKAAAPAGGQLLLLRRRAAA